MFDFLGLPREIRDEIYNLCLVRKTIEFEEFYVDETPEEWMQDRKPEALTLHVAKPDETPLLVYQGIPFVHRVESLTTIDGRSRWDDVFYEGRERSYRIHRGITSPPCLNIFLTNRLIYQEASIIFYAKNYFCFPSRECELTLNACSCFLTDRPQHALTYIGNISLGIGFIHWRHPEFNTYTDSRFYGVHWPTVQRFVNILRDILGPRGLHKLEVLLEEQCPSDKALSHRLGSEDYCDLLLRSVGISGDNNSLNNFKELQIDKIEADDRRSSDFALKYVAKFLTGIWPVHDLNLSSSTVNVGGKEMFRTRLTWSPSNDLRLCRASSFKFILENT